MCIDGFELTALFTTTKSLIQICGKNAARRKPDFVSSLFTPSHLELINESGSVRRNSISLKRIKRTESELRIKAGKPSNSYRSCLENNSPKKLHNKKIMPDNLYLDVKTSAL